MSYVKNVFKYNTFSGKPKHVEVCPYCDSKRTQNMGTAFFIIFGLCMLSFGLIFTFIIPFVGIPLLIIGVFLVFIAPFMIKMQKCRDCKKTWRKTNNKGAI